MFQIIDWVQLQMIVSMCPIIYCVQLLMIGSQINVSDHPMIGLQINVTYHYSIVYIV